jgi:hypothetical protein
VSAELAFQLLNAVVLPWWAVWLVAPRSRWAARLAGHGAVFIALGLVYTGLLAAALSTGDGEGFAFDGLRAALSHPIGFLAGWTHYLAFDLFVGAWILRESGRLDLEPRPYLFFTLMAGPLGLMSFLVRRTLRLRSAGQLGRTDLV